MVRVSRVGRNHHPPLRRTKTGHSRQARLIVALPVILRLVSRVGFNHPAEVPAVGNLVGNNHPVVEVLVSRDGNNHLVVAAGIPVSRVGSNHRRVLIPVNRDGNSLPVLAIQIQDNPVGSNHPVAT